MRTILAYAVALAAMVALIGVEASARPYYGGGSHSYSHGGSYSGGSGSSHKGGTYKNWRTGNQYGRHK